jgi:phage shock protein C
MTSAPPPVPPPVPPPPNPPDGEQPPSWAQPPIVPPVPPARPPLRRSSADKMLGGVCGGLAEYSGIDTVLWRVAFVGFALAGGAGFIVYLLLWVLMPPPVRAPDERPGPVDGLVERLHTAVSGVLPGPPRT